MRVNLQCPYDDKDAAKALGAKWDGVNRTWYIVDPGSLEPYAKWLPKGAGVFTLGHSVKAKKRSTSKNHTKTGVYAPICRCDVLPWEVCGHSAQYLLDRNKYQGVPANLWQ
jgi:hypothetical protein